MTGDRVLVTGASGFLGKHITLALLDRGYQVRATVRHPDKGEELRTAVVAHGRDPLLLSIAFADLGGDDGWEDAAAGCRYVVHTASPFPLYQPKDRFGLVPLARGGAVRVMKAARFAGAERVVMTSSIAAIGYGHGKALNRPLTEADFSNVDGPGISPYSVSKTLAEIAARETLAGSETGFVSINPVVILGPVLDRHCATSVELIRAMMRGRMPAVPRISIGLVGVGDVTAAHVAAMTKPEAEGRRFILSSASLSLREIGAELAQLFPELKGRLPRMTLPDFAVRTAALFSHQFRHVASELGVHRGHDTSPAQEVLGIVFQPAGDIIGETARSLRDLGVA